MPSEGKPIMPVTLQKHFADATRLAARDLLDATLLLPEDKRSWKPLEKGRSALDQIAECAMINGNSLSILQTHRFSMLDMDAWLAAKAKLAEDWEQCSASLLSSADEAAEAILAVPDDQLSIEIATPWRPMSVTDIIVYPYWNMSYHQGQITYIHSLLG